MASALIDIAIGTYVATGVTKVYVEASHFARPVFEKKGFVVVADLIIEANGEKLHNFKMERNLAG